MGDDGAKILVTGAAGKTGRVVLRALVARGASVRALVHRAEQVEDVQDLGVEEVVVGDLTDTRAVEAAMGSIFGVYHICPNVHAQEREIGRIAVAAARRAGIRRFVYHSVLHPGVEAMPHHWRKMRVEETLFESGLDWTILQPAPYLQNVLAGWHEIVGKGELRVPYPVATRLGMVDLDDVAEIAAITLTEPGHGAAVYELVGTEDIDQIEVAARLSLALGRSVRAIEISLDEWVGIARGRGLGRGAVDDLVQMFRYYAEFGLRGNPRVLRHLLGREPNGLDGLLGRIVPRGAASKGDAG